MDISEEQMEKIAANVASKLNGQRVERTVSNDEHNAHHLFLKKFIEDITLDRQAKRRIIESGKIWCLILFLGLSASALWSYTLDHIKSGIAQ